MNATRYLMVEMDSKAADMLEGRWRELKHALRWERDTMPPVMTDHLPADDSFPAFLAWLMLTGAKVVDLGLRRMHSGG
jgi:hypothetical protein